MKAKKWTRVWFAILIIIMPVIGIFNVVIDPYYIFKKELDFYEGPSSDKFVKTEYLKDNNNNFNSYMMSSSSLGTTDPKTIEKYLKDSKFYNLWGSSASLADNRLHLEYMIEKKYNIKNLYLQIDLWNMNKYKPSPDLHPEVLGQQSLNAYLLTRMFSFNYKALRLKLTAFKDSNLELIRLNIKNGVFNYINRDRLIKEDHKSYVDNEKTFKEDYKKDIKFTMQEKIKEHLKIIKDLCEKNKINLIVFITPHSSIQFQTFNTESYLEFLGAVAVDNNFYNFSGYNSITTNNYNYYDKDHYFSNIGELIAARIFNDTSVNVPSDFGVYITNENINEHLENLKKEIEKHDENHGDGQTLL